MRQFNLCLVEELPQGNLYSPTHEESATLSSMILFQPLRVVIMIKLRDFTCTEPPAKGFQLSFSTFRVQNISLLKQKTHNSIYTH